MSSAINEIDMEFKEIKNVNSESKDEFLTSFEAESKGKTDSQDL
jgi:hypothetical protein